MNKSRLAWITSPTFVNVIDEPHRQPFCLFKLRFCTRSLCLDLLLIENAAFETWYSSPSYDLLEPIDFIVQLILLTKCDCVLILLFVLWCSIFLYVTIDDTCQPVLLVDGNKADGWANAVVDSGKITYTPCVAKAPAIIRLCKWNIVSLKWRFQLRAPCQRWDMVDMLIINCSTNWILHNRVKID